MERQRGRFVKKSGSGEDAGAVIDFGTIAAGKAHESRLADPARLNAQMDTPASLEAEALAIVKGAPTEPDEPLNSELAQTPDPAAPSAEEVLAGYTMICTEVVDLGAGALIPAWGVTPAESNKLATAMAKAAMLWWPDMIIPPKYLALITIAGVGFEIAQARKDPRTGRYKPARLPEQVPDQAGTPATAAPAH